MQIAVKDLQKNLRLNPSRLVQKTRKILKAESVSYVDLSLVFVSAPKIRALNKKYLKHNYATDVLSFDLKDKGVLYPRKAVVGEIFISTKAVLDNAKIYDTTPTKELTLYIIHGILHLLGYADHKPQDIKRIRRKEQQLLSVFSEPKILRKSMLRPSQSRKKTRIF